MVASVLTSDGATAFLDEFARIYWVDMSNFLWVFDYIGNEPETRRKVRPIVLDGKAFPLIPVTPQVLADAANQ